MSALQVLIVRHARDARLTLIAAPLVSAVTLAIVHAWFPGPSAVSEGAGIAVAVLALLWTLYFAADAFASDASSGRLATQALLPLSSLVLWCSRLAFVTLAATAQVAWLVAFEYALQFVCGDADSLAHFEAVLWPLCAWLPMLALLGAAALLCSLLVESALAAMIAALLLLGALSLAAAGGVRALALAGVPIEPTLGQASSAAAASATLLLTLGAFSFVRGQRRLGSRAVRAMHAAWPLVTLLLVGGLATGAEVYRRIGVELENPALRYCVANSSSDGRFLALEVERTQRNNNDSPRVVWLYDIDSGVRELVAGPGHVIRDRYVSSSLPWSPEHPLRVIGISLLAPSHVAELTDVAIDGSTWRVISRGVDHLAGDDCLGTRIMPSWAHIETSKASGDRRTTTVRWIERGLSASFEGAFEDSAPARAVLPTPHPGVVLVRRGERVVLHEIDGGSERVVLDGDVAGLFMPSPDGSAVIVRGKQSTRALDAASGVLLHEPWNSKESNVRWIDSNDSARVVEVCPFGVRLRATQVVDLDTGRAFEIERDYGEPLLHRIGSRGYVFVRADADLVWVDLEGKLVRALVDR